MRDARHFQHYAAETSRTARESYAEGRGVRDPKYVIWYQQFSMRQYAEARRLLGIEERHA